MIPAIVLAAGRSSRMGRPKASLPVGDGHTFLSRIVQTLHDAGVDEVVVVLGHDADAIRASAAAQGVRARFVVNAEYDLGQWSSIVAGLAAIDTEVVEATLITLVDVPLVAADTVRAVLAQFRSTRAPIVRPTRGVEHGHPLLVARSVFDAIRQADPARGAKPVVRAHASAAGDLPVDDDGAFEDVDTDEDYARLIGARRADPSVAVERGTAR